MNRLLLVARQSPVRAAVVRRPDTLGRTRKSHVGDSYYADREAQVRDASRFLGEIYEAGGLKNRRLLLSRLNKCLLHLYLRSAEGWPSGRWRRS
jgi:hypothetical protein